MIFISITAQYFDTKINNIIEYVIYIFVSIYCAVVEINTNILCVLCVGADRQKSRLTSCCAVWLEQRQIVPKIIGKKATLEGI
jgi:hypothetical protein